MKIRRSSAATGAIAVTLSIAILGSPAGAAALCPPKLGVFGPGEWVARNITFHTSDDDGFAAAELQGNGSFTLTVDEFGQASGGLAFEGSFALAADDPSEETHAEGTFTITADLTGTGARVLAQGESAADLSGQIDVQGQDGEDVLGGNALPGFEAPIVQPYETTIVPSSSNCMQAVGTFGGGAIAYNPDGSLATDSPAVWYAFRVDKGTHGEDFEERFVELMDRAEVVLAQDPFDADILARFVLEMLEFDALLTSAEYCDDVSLGGLEPGNPAYHFLQSVMLHTMSKFVAAAEHEAYSVPDIIYVATSYLQSAALGWRGPGGCLAIDGSDDAAMDLFVRFEELLLTKYREAEEAGNRGLMRMIASAAYQLGFGRIIAEAQQS
jgi:hypothetical protein